MNPRYLLPFLLVPLLFTEGCLCSGDGVNSGDINIIGLGDEWELGEQLAAEIRQQAPIIFDPGVQAYLDELGARLVAVTDMSERPWSFHVVADTSVNAFNIPGGHVFVNSGLFLAAETPGEFAGVLAHEIAHGVARHSTERMTKTYGLNLLARLIMGGEVNLLEQIAAQVLGSGALAKFSRDDEREADRLGVEFMSQSGFDPGEMSSMFEKLLALRERQPNAVERFFSTHPLTEARIANIEQYADGIAITGPEPDASRFEQARARVRSFSARHWEPSARPAP